MRNRVIPTRFCCITVTVPLHFAGQKVSFYVSCRDKEQNKRRVSHPSHFSWSLLHEKSWSTGAEARTCQPTSRIPPCYSPVKSWKMKCSQGKRGCMQFHSFIDRSTIFNLVQVVLKKQARNRTMHTETNNISISTSASISIMLANFCLWSHVVNVKHCESM